LTNLELELAIEVFVRGFTFTRGFTHPYPPERLTPKVWVMRDAPRKSGDYRREEYVGHGISASEFDLIIWQATRGRYNVCYIRPMEENDSQIRAEFRALGYRLMVTEPFFVHRLLTVEPVEEPFQIVQVRTAAEANLLAKAARKRQILPKHLTADPPPIWEYMAMDGDKPVGWVGCVDVFETGFSWCTGMFVQAEYRRRGIARALMTRMLTDDRNADSKGNVLLASHTGAKLYPLLGYEQIGELLMFSPPR